MMFFEQPVKKTKYNKEVNHQIKIDNILYSNCENDADIYFLISFELKNITFFKNLIEKSFNKSIKYKIIYCFKYFLNIKQVKTQKGDIYYYNKLDFENYIPENSKIVCFGDSIYTLTKGNTDIQVNAFYDFIFNKTYFYSPEVKSYIFPVDEYYLCSNKNNTWNYAFLDYQIKNAINYDIIGTRKEEVLNKIYVKDIDYFLQYNMYQKEVSLDIETSGLNFYEDKIKCVTLSFDGITGYYLNWENINKNLFNIFLKDKYIIGANLLFDSKFLKFNGISNIHIDFDTLNAGHVLNEMRSNKLKTHCWLFTKYGGYEKELENYKKKYSNLKNYTNIQDNILFEYACMDSIITYKIYKEFKQQLKFISNLSLYDNAEWTLEDYYYKIVIPSLNEFIDVELNGMNININELRRLSKEIKKEIKEIEQKITNQIFNKIKNPEDIIQNELQKISIKKINKKPFNANSDEHLAILLEKIGLPNLGRNKKGFCFVNDYTLNIWKKKGFTIAKDIEDYHEITTVYNTFIGDEYKKTGYWQYITNGKVHPNFGVMLTNGGRNYCKSPNLQNIPKRGNFAKRIRKIFSSPNENYYIGEMDAAGFQLRIGAIYSQDKEMIKAFNDLGGDLHSLTANSVLCRNISLNEFLFKKKEEPYKLYRYKAKGINFSLEFGSSSFSFARESLLQNWTLQECKDYIKENKLENKVDYLYKLMINSIEDQQNNIYKSISDKKEFSFYWAVAIDIRNKFFEKYRGLQFWHEKVDKEVKENGFVYSPFGAIRRLPQLLYAKKNDSISKNLLNIAKNSPVQNFEASLIMLTLCHVCKEIKKLNLKSRVIGTVHDSIVCYFYKGEENQVKQIAKNYFEKDNSINKGVPLELEAEISDYWGKNEIWGFGKEF